MKIKIMVQDGSSHRPMRVECYGTFQIELAGELLTLAVTDNSDKSIVEVTDYLSGMRWPTTLVLVPTPNRGSEVVYDKSLYAPLLKLLVETDIKARISVPMTVTTEESLLRQIRHMQKLYKSNEEDF